MGGGRRLVGLAFLAAARRVDGLGTRTDGRAPWQEAAQAGPVSLTVRAYEEDQPGDRIREQLAATWPAFRRWWRDGANSRPAAGEARARLQEHMPELVPTWDG